TDLSRGTLQAAHGSFSETRVFRPQPRIRFPTSASRRQTIHPGPAHSFNESLGADWVLKLKTATIKLRVAILDRLLRLLAAVMQHSALYYGVDLRDVVNI